MNLRTAAGLRKAVPVLATCVVHRHCTFDEAMAMLVMNYMRHVWRGSDASLDRFWDGALDALNEAVETAERVADDWSSLEHAYLR